MKYDKEMVKKIKRKQNIKVVKVFLVLITAAIVMLIILSVSPNNETSKEIVGRSKIEMQLEKIKVHFNDQNIMVLSKRNLFTNIYVFIPTNSYEVHTEDGAKYIVTFKKGEIIVKEIEK